MVHPDDQGQHRPHHGDGVITEAKAVKRSEPFGITVDADGDPWYTMMSANKIGELRLR